MSNPIPLSDSPALQALLSASDRGERISVLSELMNEYPGEALAAEETVCKAVAGIGDDKDSPEDRLSSLAFLLRFVERNREFKKISDGPLTRLLVAELAPLSGLLDNKQKMKIAALIGSKRLPWAATYLAREVASPGMPERIRVALALALFRSSSTWSSALTCLSSPLLSEVSQASVSDQEVMRFVSGVLAAAREAMEKTALDPGQDLGSVLLVMIEALRQRQFAGDRSTSGRAAVGAEVAAIVSVATSSHPVFLADSALFSALAAARGLTKVGRDFPSIVKSIDAIAVRLKNGIALAARHGVADSTLFANLESVAGSRDGALKLTRQVARDIPSLSEDLQIWLREGALPTISGNVLSDSDDHAIGVLLLRAYEYQGLKDAQRTSSVGAALAIEALAVARKRGIELMGTPGDAVQFDPQSHRLMGQSNTPVRNVIITVPAVIRRRSDGGSALLIPAVVRVKSD